MEIEVVFLTPYTEGGYSSEKLDEAMANGEWEDNIKSHKESVAEKVLKTRGILGVDIETKRSDTIKIDVDPTELPNIRIMLAEVLRIPELV